METSSFIPNYPGHGVEGGTKTPQVSEVFGGNTPDMFQMADESDAWSEEMGDDSVFYSDEEQEQKDTRAFLSSHFGVKRCRQLVNSISGGETAQNIEEDPGEVFINYGSLEKQITWTKEECHNLHMLTAHKIDALQSGKRPVVSSKKLATSCKDVQQQHGEAVDIQTKHDKDTPEEKVNSQASPSTHNLLNQFNENSQHLPKAETQRVKNRQFQTHPEFPKNPNPRRSTLPPLEKSGCGGFNHLTSSKYSTVSYRRIRRGNTQQKIKDFEIKLRKK